MAGQAHVYFVCNPQQRAQRAQLAQTDVWTRKALERLTDQQLETEVQAWVQAGLDVDHPWIHPEYDRRFHVRMARYYARQIAGANPQHSDYLTWKHTGFDKFDAFLTRYWREMQLFGRPRTVPEYLY